MTCCSIFLYLNGDIVKKDEDEFKAAAESGELTPEQVERGWREFEATLERIERGDFIYFDLAKAHYEQLKQKL